MSVAEFTGARNSGYRDHTRAVMSAFASTLLLALWVAARATGEEETPASLPVQHRPGAILIIGPQVSPSRGTYRLIIDLPTYDYAVELSAMKAFANISTNSQTIIDGLHQKILIQSSLSASTLS